MQRAITGGTRWPSQAPFCLRQQGTYHFICFSFFRSASEKTKNKKKRKYRCERPYLGYRVTPVNNCVILHLSRWRSYDPDPSHTAGDIGLGRVGHARRSSIGAAVGHRQGGRMAAAQPGGDAGSAAGAGAEHAIGVSARRAAAPHNADGDGGSLAAAASPTCFAASSG